MRINIHIPSEHKDVLRRLVDTFEVEHGEVNTIYIEYRTGETEEITGDNISVSKATTVAEEAKQQNLTVSGGDA